MGTTSTSPASADERTTFQSTDGMAACYGRGPIYDEPVTTVVFLRGVNLGNRRITNPELAAAFGRLGFENASPYQASGNIILPGVEVAEAGPLETGLAHELGWMVSVYPRTARQLREIVHSPFAGQRGENGGKPQIVLVAGPVAADAHRTLAGCFPDGDLFAIGPSVVHWLPNGGMAGSGPVQQELDRVLGATTVRTLGTVERIVARIEQPDDRQPDDRPIDRIEE